MKPPHTEGSGRESFLARLHARLEAPLAFLGTVWLLLLVIDLTRGLSPLLQAAFRVIWVLFIADFAVEFALAPRKLGYLRRNWLTALSLAVPALRVFRVLRVAFLVRAAGAARVTRLIGVLGSINRGMRALGRSLRRRGIGYVVLLTVIVVLAGAAGMYSFEKDATEDLSDYGSALWWTAMIMTTMGSGDWPRTPEGRVLCLLLAVYSFTIFGYITAALASFFVGQDRGAASPPERDAQAGDLAARIDHLSRQLEELERARKTP
jgi:voltage-gated potassium channel